MTNPRPFLLTETLTVEPPWLEDWPLGGVALVIGSSAEMRSVRTNVQKVGWAGFLWPWVCPRIPPEIQFHRVFHR